MLFNGVFCFRNGHRNTLFLELDSCKKLELNKQKKSTQMSGFSCSVGAEGFEPPTPWV